MSKNKNDIQEVKTVIENQYSKEQLIKSKKYMANVDILQVVLEDSRKYTFTEVDDIIDKFKKGVCK